MKKKTYIASSEIEKSLYSKHKDCWSIVEKVPISKIKIDSRLFSYPNEIDVTNVEHIVENFELDLWAPVLVNEEYYLLDGQHRLEIAKRMQLTHIDVVVQHIANYSYYFGKEVKGLPSNA